MSENPKSSLEKARKLRREMTHQESILWETLRSRQFHDVKFRRQQQVGYYIADFCSFEQKLIVELDGAHHAEHDQSEYDQERGKFFRDQGFTTLRFWNEEVDKNLPNVLRRIKESLAPCGRGIKQSR